MTLKDQNKKVRQLLKAIADLLIHFSIEELQELHDYIASLKDE